MTKIKNILKQLEGLVIELKTRMNYFIKARVKIIFYQMILVFFVLSIINISIFSLVKNNIFVSPKLKEYILSIEGYQDENISENYLREEFEELLLKSMITSDILILFIVFMISVIISKKIIIPLERVRKREIEFLSLASHELRTPLTTMKIGGELYYHGEYGVDDYKIFIKNQLNEINYLINLSNNLLDLLRSDEVVKSKEKINLSSLLKEKIKLFSDEFKSKNIDLNRKIESDIFVKGSKFEFSILLNNLVKNSIIHNKKNNPWVNIKLFQNKNKVFLIVSNNAEIIDKDKLDFIFDKFYKINNKESSSGLGLSIVKTILDKYDGKISIVSNKINGFIVKIELVNNK